MADFKTRAPSLYLDGVKMATIEGHKFTYSSGDEIQFGDPGALGFSDGAPVSGMSATGIVPTAGNKVKVMRLMQQKHTFDVGYGVVDGDIVQVPMRATKAEFTGSHKAGTLMGDFEFIGLDPNITG